MTNEPPKVSNTKPVRPSLILLGAVVIYVIYFFLMIPFVGEESIFTAAFGIAGGIFLVWSIVAAVKQRRL